MVSCKQCSTNNGLDSSFCKRCGTALPEEDLAEARVRLDTLIEEGNGLFNQGRTDEAMAIAENAVQANASNASAYALKSLCHERRGEIADALECAEKVVDLNPDSELDKIRRNTLRARFAQELRVPEAPDRRLAIIGAAASVVLVICVGALIARVSSSSNTKTVSVLDGGQAPKSTSPVETNASGQADSGSNQTNQQAGGATGNDNNTVTNPGLTTAPGPGDVPPIRQQTPPPVTSNPTFRLPTSNETTLPMPGGRINPGDLNVEPVRPPDFRNLGQGEEPIRVPSDPTTRRSGNAEDPVVTGPVNDPGERKNTGTIEINVRNGGGNRVPGGAEPVNSANGLEALVRVGNQQFQLGNFAAASRSFEQAVGMGGDAVSLNRRLGQAYERLGRTSDAVEAYRRCVSAVDAAIASGRGNRESLENTKETCLQALKVLGG